MNQFRLPTEVESDASDKWGQVFVAELIADENRLQQIDGPVAEVAGAAGLGLPGGGWVRFLNLNEAELRLFFVVPENGLPGYHPVNGTMLNLDGFWFRYITTHWYKVPDGALVWAYKDAQGYLQLLVRNYFPGYYPEWVQPVNPYVPTVPYPW